MQTKDWVNLALGIIGTLTGSMACYWRWAERKLDRAILVINTSSSLTMNRDRRAHRSIQIRLTNAGRRLIRIDKVEIKSTKKAGNDANEGPIDLNLGIIPFTLDEYESKTFPDGDLMLSDGLQVALHSMGSTAKVIVTDSLQKTHEESLQICEWLLATPFPYKRPLFPTL